MRRIALHLADPQLARLRSWSEGTGLSVAELVRRALDAYLPDERRSPAGERAEAGAVASSRY